MAQVTKRAGAPAGLFTVQTADGTFTFDDASNLTQTFSDAVANNLIQHPYLALVGGASAAAGPAALSDLFLVNGFPSTGARSAPVTMPGLVTSHRARALPDASALTVTITDQAALTLPGSGSLTAATSKTWAASDGSLGLKVPFNYSGGDIAMSSGNKFAEPLVPTSDITQARFANGASPMRVEFDYDGDILALWHTFNAGGGKWRVYANEQVSADQNVPTTGGERYTMIDFGSAAQRRIIIEFDGPGAYFAGVLAPKTRTIAASSYRSSKVAWVGDSYAAGQGNSTSGINSLSSYAQFAAHRMGFTNVRTYAVGGTGFVKDTVNVARNYIYRIRDIGAFGTPDVIVVQGSINDNTFTGAGTITPAVITYINALRALYPLARIVGISPLGVNGVADVLSTETVAGFVATGTPYIDLHQLFTGTGKVGTPVGDGNADYYQSATYANHPSLAGHDVLGRQVAAGLAPLLGVTV